MDMPKAFKLTVDRHSLKSGTVFFYVESQKRYCNEVMPEIKVNANGALSLVSRGQAKWILKTNGT